MKTQPQKQIVLEYDKEVNIATAPSRKASKWKNSQVTVSKFISKLSKPVRTNETVNEYLRMPKDVQDNIKDVGAFVGGSLKGGKRGKADVANRHLLTFDADYCNPETIDTIKKVLKPYNYVVYSTHKHTPDKPRLRLVVCPNRPLMPDEYQPVMRAIAEKIDIDAFDPTTYDINRLMYWPSCPADGEYVFFYNDPGAFLDVEKVLGSYGDRDNKDAWKDVNLWPTADRETKLLQRLLKKQADPMSKKSIVGAFCRVISIKDAIEGYLSDIYRKETTGRYTYIEGTSTNGLVLYDNKFVYSNHASDPASAQTCNAFDIVRIHKFGHLDNNIKSDMPTNKLPSYTAMVEFARGIKDVEIEFSKMGLEISADDFDFDDFENNVEWLTDLQKMENGVTKSTFYNAYLIVSNDPQIKNIMAMNEFSQKMENTKTKQTWTDWDSISVRVHVGRRYNVDFSERKVEDAISKRAQVNSYNPVKDYLESLKWDGVERVETIFIDYMGSEDNPYIRAVAKYWFVAAVARVCEPGYKFDNAIVISGKQGVGKTSFVRELAKKKWYGELSSFDPKIAIEEISGKWLIEINEMGATRKQELEQQKSFLSATHTTVRMAYARHAKDFKRQCVFMGTTNDTEYLKDDTGNRRWWPVDCNVDWINLDKLASEVDQIWAEACLMYAQGVPTILDKGLFEAAESIQDDKKLDNPWIGQIEEWLETEAPIDRYERERFEVETEIRDRVCVIEIWKDCFEKKDKPRPSESKQIGVILNNFKNWEKKGPMRFGSRFGVQRGWMKNVPF